jgi:hypothetical protein
MPVDTRPTARKWRTLRWAALLGGLTLLLVLGVGLFQLSPRYLKPHAERELSAKLGLDVTIETMRLTMRPHLRVSASKVVFRVPSQPDLPPFIAIDSLWADVGLFSALRRHVNTVHVQGMRITVPPGDRRNDVPGPQGGSGDVVVDLLEARDAVLTLARRDPSKDALVFRIKALDVRDVNFARAMPFSAELTNPVPEGQVTSHGLIGPWRKGDPAGLPLSGVYTFTLANLDTIRGIGGTLTSEGRYQGHLTRIEVEGTTETPNFNLDLGGQPVPLSTTFKAIVDGSDGSTALEAVRATFADTVVDVTGTVENLPGPGRHDIKLDVDVGEGRIEDLLRLAVDAPEPILSGDVTMTAAVALPPGRAVVRDRMRIEGQFGLSRGRFASDTVQAKLLEFSRRSQGKDKGVALPAVSTDLSGRFTVASGTLKLSALTFTVPGANVELDGTYALGTSAMNFTGTLRMQASVSKAVGGFRSLFLKPFDGLFRRDGAGAVVPIRITGTRDAPKVGIRMGDIFKRGG